MATQKVKLLASFAMGTVAAAAVCVVVEWVRRRNRGLHELLVDDSMHGLAALRHISNLKALPALSRAVVEMESVSVKLLEAMDHHGNLRSGETTRLNANQVMVLQRVEEQLRSFSTNISTILADAVVNSLPLACHLRRGGEPPRCAMDIGGTLCKVIVVSKGDDPAAPPPLIKEEGAMSLEFEGCPKLDLTFFTFPSSHLDQCMAFLQQQGITSHTIPTTGGGGHKHRELFLETMGVSLTPVEEMAAVITGVNQRLLSGDREVFQYKWKKDGKKDDSSHTKTPPPMNRANTWDGRG